MKEYAEKPPVVAKRYELAKNLFMDVTFGGKTASVSINGTHCIMNDCGQCVILISNQSREQVTIAGAIDGEALIDTTRAPGQNEYIVLSPGDVSKLLPPETPFKKHEELFIIGVVGDQLIEQTLLFKHSQRTQTMM
jgi:hypothetical protein